MTKVSIIRFKPKPECFDENGQFIADDILAVRFENPEDFSETE